MRKAINKIIMVLNIVLLSGILSCKKYLDVPLPNDQVANETVFSAKATIDAVITGMYSAFCEGHLTINVRALANIADEAEGNFSDDQLMLQTGSFSSSNTYYLFVSWAAYYKIIYRANLILENLPDVQASVIADALKKQYLAAAHFVRAAIYFELVRSWGDVPLITTTNIAENISKPRNTVSEIYALIVNDLQAAITDLPATSTTPRSVSNKNIPQALLARVNLAQGKWPEAEAAATAVINSGNYQLPSNLGFTGSSAFARGSKEIIMSFAETASDNISVNRSWLGWVTLPESPQNAPLFNSLPSTLINSFEPRDLRAVDGNWMITLYGLKFSNKYWYGSPTSQTSQITIPQDYVYLRLAEQYLIRAEARAQQNNIGGAANDLNMIRARAGLGNTTAADKASLLTAVENERRHEFFYEGHRWYDLVRTNRADEVLGTLSYKSANWKPTNKLWPIPANELILNPYLKQNPGY